MASESKVTTIFLNEFDIVNIVKKYYTYLRLTVLVLYSISMRFYDKFGHFVNNLFYGLEIQEDIHDSLEELWMESVL